MVICGSRFPAEGRLMPLCTSGLRSRCSRFSCCEALSWRTLLSSLQGWENSTPAKRAPSWGELLSAVTDIFVVRDLHFACFSSSVCMAWPVHCITTVLNHSGSQIRHRVLWFFYNPLTNVLCPSTEKDLSI